jgi:phage terminase large subunit-like protein
VIPYKNYIYEYHAKITSGEIIAGKWIKQIYKIIVDALEKQEYFFNAKAANKAIKFIENFCHHSKGRNDLLKLELWQKAIVSVIFGVQDEEKIRIFREIFIVIGRKNGKSLFASAIIAYMAFLEPEYGQEIYCLAPKLDQAALYTTAFIKWYWQSRSLKSWRRNAAVIFTLRKATRL